MNDYFCENLLRYAQYRQLSEHIKNFLHKILIEGFIKNSFLKDESICIEKFKERKYISFKFNSETVYNSLKIDKYDMGKRIFDEVIRKVLGPMNNYMTPKKDFNGYKITMIGVTKSFLDENTEPEEVIYDFYMPREEVKLYKEKDISGQTLLDRSIILMDDERVEFKLQ